MMDEEKPQVKDPKYLIIAIVAFSAFMGFLVGMAVNGRTGGIAIVGVFTLFLGIFIRELRQEFYDLRKAKTEGTGGR